MRLTKMVYIASSYTDKNPNHTTSQKLSTERYRERRITEVIGRLHDSYPYAFIGPITQSHQTVTFRRNKDTTFLNWARIDFTYISRCDEIWVYADIEGSWKESTGVIAEIEFAVANEIPVKFIDSKTLRVKKMKLKSNKKVTV